MQNVIAFLMCTVLLFRSCRPRRWAAAIKKHVPSRGQCQCKFSDESP